MEVLVVLEDVSSQQFMEITVLACPMCHHAWMQRLYLRAGPAAFVAAATCPTCRCLVRANNAFSIESRSIP